MWSLVTILPDLSKKKCEEQSDEILYPLETRDFF